ncbi:DKNYY domain-containing protein [Gallaecimonas xiamenensis]|uniref:DKNYY family protein n=1 Tax=Gallaecimonas xiamenensis 3-C-1 TaxID=745411 RepID=K2K1B4_9GAMM|nr:DKNYY domain-containing protein [Gallaecimonas xiamenensis]EKE76594.1 hypothetical protein B3C1_03335 [Gallaecimonas xiamenensis 3-C-1]
MVMRGYYKAGDCVFWISRQLHCDTDSFEHLGGAYARDKAQGFYAGYPKAKMDAASLCYLGGYFAKDKHHIYYEGTAMPKVDRDSACYLGEDLLRDKTQVFCRRRLLPGADPETIVALDCYHSRDASQAFFVNKVIKDAHLASFTPLGDGLQLFARDQDRVYYQGRPIKGADPNTFESLGGTLARCQNGYYDAGKAIPALAAGGQ